jgi:hypothetical protein
VPQHQGRSRSPVRRIRGRTRLSSGDTTSSTMIDKGQQSCRTRMPGASLRDHENRNGAVDAEARYAHALGRSRGALTTRIHLSCDAAAARWASSSRAATSTTAHSSSRSSHRSRSATWGRGRPCTPPDHLLGDRGYSSRRIRNHPRKHGIPHTNPERSDQRAHRRRRGATAADQPLSTRTATSSATSSSAASTR